jgi:S1-C subfamily serine protease
LTATDASSTDTTLLKTNSANNDTLGGPIVNIKGELVGIAVKAGLVLPVSEVSALIDSLK